MSDSNLQVAADILYIISENYTIGNTHTPMQDPNVSIGCKRFINH
jgi:hypothetical protein